MTPERASTVFRELLQTPDAEISMFSRRAGLTYSFGAEDLLMARELLEALGAAFETGSSRDWEAVRAAFGGLRTKRNPFLLGGAPGLGVHGLSASGPSSAEPAPPPLVNRVVIAKPSLGDAAPGTREHAEQAKARFVPVARPRGGGGDPLAAAPPSPPSPAAAYPVVAGAPVPPAGYVAPVAAPLPPPPAHGAPAPPIDDWHKALPAQPAFLAPIDASSAAIPTGGPFTRAAPAAPMGPVASPVVAAPPYAAQPYVPPAAPVHRSAAPPPPPRRGGASPEPTSNAAAATADAGAEAGSVHESVARYAAFCAACAEFPARLTETRAGYGVADDAARAALDSAWQDRFDDDPELLSRWEQLFVSFRRSLRAGG